MKNIIATSITYKRSWCHESTLQALSGSYSKLQDGMKGRYFCWGIYRFFQTFKLPFGKWYTPYILIVCQMSTSQATPSSSKTRLKSKQIIFFKLPFESQLFLTKMSDFTIYRNGNCTNTTSAEAEDQIYISVDFDYLRDSESDYCQETIICGENYISLRRFFKYWLR